MECKRCGIELISKKHNLKYCERCRKIVSKEQTKESKKRNRLKILSYEKSRYNKDKERIKSVVKEYQIRNKNLIKEKNKNYYQKNKERLKKYQREYRKKYPEKVSLRNKIYRSKNIDKFIKKDKEYYQKNKEIILKKSKEYRSKPEVKVMLQKSRKKYRKNNREKLTKMNKDYRERNIKKFKDYQKEYRIKNRKELSKKFLNRLRDNLDFRIKHILRGNLRKTLQLYAKEGKTMKAKLYGVDYESIIEYLKPFPKDREKYHIDHIIPLCSFKFIKDDGSIDLEEIKKAFAPENHQWLLKEENLKKTRQDKLLSIHKKNENPN